jgi:hypothetical protein
MIDPAVTIRTIEFITGGFSYFPIPLFFALGGTLRIFGLKTVPSGSTNEIGSRVVLNLQD